MFTLVRHSRVATCWLLSFLRSSRLPKHYPIELRKQSGVPTEATWYAYVLNWPGPSGLGATADAARSALERNLQEIAAARWSRGEQMPRPGSRVPIAFASSERVSEDPELLDEFIVKALGFSLDDPVFISDMSSIEDFGDEIEVQAIRSRIEEHFGIAVIEGESALVADLLTRIRAAR